MTLRESDQNEIHSAVSDDYNVFHEAPQTPVRSASLRPRTNLRQPERWNYNNLAEALIVDSEEPSNYRDAISRTDNKEWRKAMNNEMASLMLKNTWVLCKLPVG